MSESDKNLVNEGTPNSNDIQTTDKNNIKGRNNNDSLEGLATNTLEDANNYNLVRTLVSPDESPNNLEFMNKKINNEDILTENLNYNKDPYLSPNMKKKNNNVLSRLDKMIINYNKIKEEFNTILSYDSSNNKKSDKAKLKKISKFNFKMINQLNQLNDFLNFLIDNKNIYREKSLFISPIKPKKQSDYESIISTNLESSEKILIAFSKQYNKIEERLSQIKNDQYLSEIKSQINGLNQEISILEKENKSLRKEQILTENSFQKKENNHNANKLDNVYTEKSNEFSKYSDAISKINNKIENDKETIKINETKINELNNKCKELTQFAKNNYGINEINKIENLQREKQNKEMTEQRLIKKYETEITSIKSKINKLKFQQKINTKSIQEISEEKIIIKSQIETKQLELKQLNQKLNLYEQDPAKAVLGEIGYNPNRKKLVLKLEPFNKDQNRSHKNVNLFDKESISSVPNKKMANIPSFISQQQKQNSIYDINSLSNKNTIEANKRIPINSLSYEKTEIKKGKNLKLKIDANNNKKISKEMVIKNLDEQGKQNRNFIPSLRYDFPLNPFDKCDECNDNKNTNTDKKKRLKWNFSFTSNMRNKKLNLSVNNSPIERQNTLPGSEINEIKEDILIDNSLQDNSNNIKEIKVKKIINDDNNGKESVQIEKKNSDENLKALSENNDKDENKRENVLNTVVFNVQDNENNKEKDNSNSNNNSNSNSNNNINNSNKNSVNENKNIEDNKENNISEKNKFMNQKQEENSISVDPEEEYVFDKNIDKNEKNDAINDNELNKKQNMEEEEDYDDGDDIINADYTNI